MSELTIQSQVFESIKSLCANYKKDSASRKTTEYLTKRLISLDSQWNDFAQRNQLMLTTMEDRNQPYFMENIYEKTEELYNNTKTDILKNMLAATKRTSNKQTNHLSNDNTEILLTTAQVRVKAANGTYITLRALIDQGSQVNLISENATQLLNLPRKKMNASISGVGSVARDCTGYVNLECKSIHSDYGFQSKTLVMKKLINNLPNQSFPAPNWAHIQNLKLADPEFYISRRVDILLGADIYSDIIMEGVLKPERLSTAAQQTQLGWILCGSTRTLNCCVTLNNLNELKQFWETEDIIQTTHDIPADDYCELYYQKTTRRDADGKYTVMMPLYENIQEKLGNSKPIAISQFLQLEKRLSRNSALKTMYKDFINEYIDLGHMKPSTSRALTQCFLPHHGVLRENSTTTKLRVVFNASQKTSSGYSLNDLMETGPSLQKDIQTLILKWRSYEFVFTADIEKMFRCMMLDAEQRPLQKILWRDSPHDILQEMELCTITYGTKSAPWLAMRTLKQLALDDGHKYPEAAKTLVNECYVDDVISGHHSLQDAKELQRSLIALLKGGGMNLRKWSSNKPELLEDLRPEQIAKAETFDFKNETSQKTLGLTWDPKSDIFKFSWKSNNYKKQQTKRLLLSEISTLYDPLGWLAPITVSAKLLFQEVWISKIAWDESLSEDIDKKWEKLRNELILINDVKLNRWIGSNKQQNIELHGFCDASEKAYTCVVYCRVMDKGDHPIVTLLAAKTKVAPLSQSTSLPKLELCGALLLSQLMGKITEALQDSSVTLQAWCDSKVVLAWIQGHMKKWEKYVSNRVTKIVNVIPAEKWNYVHTSVNPADCASRGLSPSKLMNYELWWQGPSFLHSHEREQHLGNCLFTTDLGIEELQSQSCIVQEEQTNDNFIYNLLQKSSSLTHIYRVVARVKRAIAAMRRQPETTANFITADELNKSAVLVAQFIQQHEYYDEIKKLKKNEIVSSKSKIFKLNPYLDENDLIRVGGRLKNSNLPANVKNPIILPHTGRLTELVIDQAHSVTLHGGARLTLAQVRQRFWIISGNKAVKTRLRNCVTCHRHKVTENHQIMSDLPKQRITPSRPFTHTGVDFTGSIDVKINKGRGVRTSKGYIVIFVCMATKAVHIELTSDLSTETFIGAFKRMCGRRGTPEHVYSDNGTNFVGASKVLQQDFKEFVQQLSPEFFNEISKMGVNRHFNAASWPSAVGLWEAAIKSMKHHLKRTLGDQKLTYEELHILLTEIEGCMNSRPLCPLTEDPEEFYNYLTPGHFLTGGPILSLPQSDRSDVRDIDIRKRWQLTCHMLQRFWKTWSGDYLHQLQVRSKWQKPMPNIQEGAVVLIKEDNLPPGKWALGRVVELHPGSDNKVRVTTLKTKNGFIKRPITKLSPLPVDTENQKSLHQQLAYVQSNQRNETSNAPSLRCSKGTKRHFSFLFTILTLFTIITGSQVNASYTNTQVTSLENRPIYYDLHGNIQLIHDEWILLMYYNLTTYWGGTRNMQSYLDHLNNACDKMEPTYCRNIINQLYHEMDILNHFNTILLAPHQHQSSRKRRGLIDGVGYLANDLFGVLDERFAQKYNEDIKAVQTNENYLLALVKNQTSIVELENSALKKSEANIKQQFDNINMFLQHVNESFTNIKTDMEALMATNYFSSSAIIATLLINNLRRMQETFFDTLTDIHQGHIDMHLLTPANLIKQLSEISGHLPRTLFLPVDDVKEDIKDIYKLLYVRGRITQSYFLFEVHIPLVCDENFTFYRPIPLPITINNQTSKWVQVSSNFIAVNLRKNTYLTLSQEYIKRCTLRSKDNYLCSAKVPIYNLHNNKAPCEAKLLDQRTTLPCETASAQCRDSWVKLHSSNTWLIICCDKCTIRIICESDVTTHMITTSSFITIAQGCLLQAEELTIYSHNQYNSKVNMDSDIHIPAINDSINKVVDLSIQKMPDLYQSDTSALYKEIDERLTTQTQKENQGLTMSSHDIHQYFISYLILVAVLTAGVVWVARKRCRGTGHRAPRRNTQLPEDIEMQVIQPTTSATEAKNTAESADNVAFTFD